jgi:hypothetical protein
MQNHLLFGSWSSRKPGPCAGPSAIDCKTSKRKAGWHRPSPRMTFHSVPMLARCGDLRCSRRTGFRSDSIESHDPASGKHGEVAGFGTERGVPTAVKCYCGGAGDIYNPRSKGQESRPGWSTTDKCWLPKVGTGRNTGRGHERRIRANAPAAGQPQTADPAGGQGGFRLGPPADSRSAANMCAGANHRSLTTVTVIGIADDDPGRGIKNATASIDPGSPIPDQHLLRGQTEQQHPFRQPYTRASDLPPPPARRSSADCHRKHLRGGNLLVRPSNGQRSS